MIKQHVKWTLLLLAMLVMCVIPGTAKDQEIVILHTNDLHGHSLARIATMVEECRIEHPNLLLLDAGDLFSGTPVSSTFRGEAEQSAVLTLGYDALALGNHDFDFGMVTLERSLDAGLPWLSANIVREDGTPFVEPFLIKEVGDMRVLIVGLTSTSTPQMTFPRNVQGLVFMDPASTVRQILDGLTGAYDFCIVLSHLGYGEDVILAQEVPGITAIIGGHSHTVLDPPVTIGDTLVTQAGSSGSHLGKIEIRYDEGYLAQGDLLKVAQHIEPHPTIEALDAFYGAALDMEMEREVGYTSRGYTKNGMGMLLNQALLAFSGADAALYNAGGVRQGLERGPITKGDVFAVEPFGNEAVLVTLSGPAFAELLEVKKRRSSDFYDGPRLIDVSRSYTVVTSDFLASPGSNYPMLAQGHISYLGVSVRDILEEYLETKVLQTSKKEGSL